MPNSSIQTILHLSAIYLSHLEESVFLDTKVDFFERRRQDVDDQAQRKQTLNKCSGVFY